MRCNRETSGFAVTPRKKVVDSFKYYQDWAATPPRKSQIGNC